MSESYTDTSPPDPERFVSARVSNGGRLGDDQDPRSAAEPRTMPDCVASDKSGDDDGVVEDGLI